MGSWYAVDAIGEAIGRAKEFFRGPGLLGKWLKLAILVFVFLVLSGGGGGDFNWVYRANEIPAELPAMPAVALETAVVAGVAILSVLLVLGIILSLIRNMCFFAILESITKDKVGVFSYMRRFFSLAFSLAVFELVLGIIGMPFALCTIACIAGLVFIFLPATKAVVLASAAANPWLISLINFISMPAVIAITGIVALAGLLVFLIINYIKDQFARYLMHREGRRAWGSFKTCLGLARRNLAQVGMLALVQIGVGIAAAVIAVIVAMVIVIPAIIMAAIAAVISVALVAAAPLLIIPLIILAIMAFLVVVFVINLILLPMHVFFCWFNIIVLGKLAGEKKVIRVAKWAGRK